MRRAVATPPEPVVDQLKFRGILALAWLEGSTQRGSISRPSSAASEASSETLKSTDPLTQPEHSWDGEGYNSASD